MDVALKLHQKAANAEPANADRPYELVRDFIIFQRPALAVQQAEWACDLLPNDPWIRAYLAEQFLRYGYRDLAQRYLDCAQALAESRKVEAVRELIAGLRDELSRLGMLSVGRRPASSSN